MQNIIKRAYALYTTQPFSTMSSVMKPRKKSNVYTRTGDKGMTSLYNGERRSKTDITFEVLGTQDELNCVIGIAREYSRENGIEPMLVEIQSRIFDLGSAVATPLQNSSERKLQYTEFSPQHTQKLEEWIDQMDNELPPLTNFILPSGGLFATHLNLARSICRRAERTVYPLIENGQVDVEVGKYLNRLSDFLFVASRMAAFKDGKPETIWKKSREVKEGDGMKEEV